MTLYLSLTMSSQVRQNDKDLSVNLLLIFLFLVGVRSESTSLADDEESLLANFSLPEELGETLRGLLTDDNFGELSDASDAEEELLDDEVPEHEEEDDEMPEHHFEVKQTVVKSGAKKGQSSVKVSLVIGNNTFRKRKEINERATFSCNLCEAEKRFVSATAEVVDGQYKLREFPKPEDHICWASGQDISIRAARTMMYKMIEEDPTRPVLDIYEEVRKTFTEGMDMTEMQAFLAEFPSYRAIQSRLYKKRIIYSKIIYINEAVIPMKRNR